MVWCRVPSNSAFLKTSFSRSLSSIRGEHAHLAVPLLGILEEIAQTDELEPLLVQDGLERNLLLLWRLVKGACGRVGDEEKGDKPTRRGARHWGVPALVRKQNDNCPCDNDDKNWACVLSTSPKASPLGRLDPAAQGLSDEDVVRRRGRLFPPRNKSRRPLAVSDEWVQGRLKDVRWVEQARKRLQSLSWFMKCLKEPLSRLANRQEQTRGAFFEGRLKSVAILDEEALLATCVYIDLNPVAAGIAEVPGLRLRGHGFA